MNRGKKNCEGPKTRKRLRTRKTKEKGQTFNKLTEKTKMMKVHRQGSMLVENNHLITGEIIDSYNIAHSY